MFLFKVRKVVRNISTIREIHWYTKLTEVVKKRKYMGGGINAVSYELLNGVRKNNIYLETIENSSLNILFYKGSIKFVYMLSNVELSPNTSSMT